MTLLLHLSDTHFGTERAEAAAALVRLARERRPDVAVLSGDITQRARAAQFAAARRFIDALCVPVRLALPGNHDVPLFNLAARVFRPYAGYRRAFGADLEPSLTTDELLLACVNTTRLRRRVDGEISPAQIDRVARALSAAKPEQLRVVVVHHPLVAIRETDRANLAHGHREAVRAWAASGADLVLGGHIHLAYVRDVRESFPELRRPVWVVQAGTAVSRRVREGRPNSVNLIRYDPGPPRRCFVERLDFDAASGFQVGETHAMILAP